MGFERPWLLVTLLLVPVVVAGYLLVQRRRARYTVRFPNLDVLATVAAGQRSWRRHLTASLLGVAIVSLVVATARPQVTRLAPVERATVILVIDISRSMESRDVRPSRLAAARAAARQFVDRVPTALRVGLIVFSGEVHLATPPTVDHELVRQSIAAIDPYSLGFGGTAIGDALARAVEVARDAVRDRGLASVATPARPADPDGAVSILFLSDGRQNRGVLQPAEGTRLAMEAGIPVYTVALGSTEESPFGGRYRAPDPTTLRMIAQRTGGEFFQARSREALSAAYEDLGSRLGRAPRRSEVTFAFVAAAAAVLVAAALLSPSVRPRLP